MQLLPAIAAAFAELGYRRATTAELARRCGVRENILYRLWADKKAMFIAAIGYVYELSEGIWKELLAKGVGSRDAAPRLMAYESEHQGEFGFYRIVFAGLGESDDPEIRTALSRMYLRFQGFIREQIEPGDAASKASPDAALRAWAILGLGTMSNIAQEFGLMSRRTRERLLQEVGLYLLEGRR